MNKIAVYDKNGQQVESWHLPKEILDLKINNNLLHQVVNSYLSNQRDSKAHSKTRAEISGGGRKPWRQKGTGRARSGSIRNPIWIGGGTIFGPKKQKNYYKKINQKMNKQAVRQALAAKIKDKQLYLIDNLQFDKIKTRLALDFLNKMPIIDGSILLITDQQEKNINLSFRNLPYCKTSLVSNINCFDIIKFCNIIVTKEAWNFINKKFFTASEFKFEKVKELKQKDQNKNDKINIISKKTQGNK